MSLGYHIDYWTSQLPVPATIAVALAASLCLAGGLAQAKQAGPITCREPLGPERSRPEGLQVEPVALC